MRKKAPSTSGSTASPSTSIEGGGVLVLVELGGEWPSCMAAVSGSGSGSVSGRAAQPVARRVVAQLEGESPAAFAERVANSLDSLFGRGVRLETLVLACNERLDEPADSARRKTLSLALGSMAKQKSGRAYLAASARSGGRLRHALSALAQGSFDEWRTAGLEVSVDFGEESRAATPFASTALSARVA